MVTIAVSTISSKGQVVIPSKLRKHFDKKVVFIEKDNQIIIKNPLDFEKSFEKDFKKAKETTKMIEEYEKGKLKTLKFDSVEDSIQYLESLE